MVMRTQGQGEKEGATKYAILLFVMGQQEGKASTTQIIDYLSDKTEMERIGFENPIKNRRGVRGNHLAKLENDGILTFDTVGGEKFYSVSDDILKVLDEFPGLYFDLRWKKMFFKTDYIEKNADSLLGFFENELRKQDYTLYPADRTAVKVCFESSPEVLRFVLHPDCYVRMSVVPKYMNHLDVHKYQKMAEGFFIAYGLNDVDLGKREVKKWLTQLFDVYYGNHLVLRYFERLLEFDLIRCNISMQTFDALTQVIAAALGDDSQDIDAMSLILKSFMKEHPNTIPQSVINELVKGVSAEK